MCFSHDINNLVINLDPTYYSFIFCFIYNIHNKCYSALVDILLCGVDKHYPREAIKSIFIASTKTEENMISYR